MTTPNFTPDWTKTGDVFVDEIGGEWRSPERLNDRRVRLTGDKHRAVFWNHGERSPSWCEPRAIVSQYTPTPAPQGVEVPQWCYAAAEEIIGHRAAYIANIIAKHAPKPEAAPATTASDAREVPATTPRWPRYFEPRIRRGLYKRVTFTSPTVCKWADGHCAYLNLAESNPAKFSLESVLKTHIETDADGNALTQPIEQQQASGVMWYVLRHREEGCGLLSSPPGLVGLVVTADEHERVVAERDAEIAELRRQSSHWYEEFSRIAHQFRVAVDPGNVQKLNPEGNAKLAVEYRTRAEAAEAKCAEYRDRFTDTNEMRLGEVRLRHAVQERAEQVEAKLAAANERIAEFDARLDAVRKMISAGQ